MRKLVSDNLYILIILSIVLLGVAVLDWAFFQTLPYGYFMFLRWIITSCSIWIGYRTYAKMSKSNTLILFGIVTILFNPIVPIVLQREIWTIIDFIVGVIFLMYLIKNYKATSD